jgi:hypothetical protein
MEARIAQFLFIVALPIVLVVGGLVSFFAVGAFFEALEDPAVLGKRIEGAFRKPAAAPKPIAADHYYQQHWAAPAKPAKVAS